MAPHATDAIRGESPRVVQLRAEIRRLAGFDAPGNPHVPTVLLLGETGTGKGLVARALHDSGPRAAGPFIDVNCAAIPETMLEAELFGFEAGAFTDAKRAKPGLFESASGGTLFLDEIDSLSRPVQSKVLKAIEEKRLRRLGAVTARDVDAKLIVATQRDLEALVATGEFRADLYHRLAVLVLHLPPLRERGDDVVHLAEYFLRRYARAHGLEEKRLHEKGRVWLRSQAWPGNVRELDHLMERATLLSAAAEVDEEVLGSLCGPTASRTIPSLPVPEMTAQGEGEEERIREALSRVGGNVVRAARLLGLGRNALRYRMRRYGIDRPTLDSLEDLPVESSSRAPRAPEAPAARAPSPEQRPAVVLALSVTLAESDALASDPWTAAARWERVIEEKVEGFGGAFTYRSPSRFTAVFGIPRALEQSAQRAVQAAQALQRAVAEAGVRPDVRMAVHAGEVLIDPSASDPLSRVFPVGDTFSLTERLLGHAGAGEVLLSPSVARRVERMCELRPRSLQLGPADTDRLNALSFVRQRPSPADAPQEDEGVAFFGRERELGTLLDAFARAASGSGQVVFVAGEAGIGKSRLLAELRRRIADRPHLWVEGHCASYGVRTPFLPLVESVRRNLGIDDQDDEASASRKVECEIERMGADLVWTLPFVKRLLSLSIRDESVLALDGASRRSELFRALRALTLRAAEDKTVVLLFEDLHWIDPATEEYLTFLQDVAPAARLLLILSHRSGYSHPFPDRSYHVRVALPPLSGEEMAAMTGALLGGARVPPAVRELIAGKAEGNPFFIEELSRSLVEQGALQRQNGDVRLAYAVDEIAVPDTIQDVLIARIDRLAEESRHAIQIASVIGREFALRLLARITESGERLREQVAELRSLELIYEKALHPELAYMFKHALTHDVAYESVAVERRRALHRTIGRVIEELYADRLPEHYETLAHHYGRGEDWEKAFLYHQRSAEKAAETHANRAAAEHCRQALAIADRLGDRVGADVRRGLSERLGAACFYLSEYAASAAAFEEAAARMDDSEARALILGSAANSHFYAHRYESARRTIDATLELSRASGFPAGEAMGLAVRGFYRGVHDADLDGFESDMERSLEICARHPNPGVEGLARMQLALAAEWSGKYEKVYESGEKALVLGRELRRPELIIFASWFIGKARCCVGDFGGALTLLQEAHDLCDRIGDRAWKSRLLNTIGWCLAEIGSHDRAVSFNERAAAVAREVGDPEIISNADVNLALNHLALGDLPRALAFLEPVEDALTRPADPWMLWRYSLHVRHTRGRVELVRGEPERALAMADEEIAGARRYRAPKIEARGLMLRSAAELALGRRAEAEDSARRASALAEKIGYRRGIWGASLLLADIAHQAGDAARSREHTLRARTVAEECARSLREDDLRRRLVAGVEAHVAG